MKILVTSEFHKGEHKAESIKGEDDCIVINKKDGYAIIPFPVILEVMEEINPSENQ